MRHLIILICCSLFGVQLFAIYPAANDILQRIDQNMVVRTMKARTKMVVQGRRASRTLESLNWTQGEDKAYAEYLSPPREKGTKMLKDGDNLWIYDPGTDRIIQISGNMLKQSVMGSDLSYEDFMEEDKLQQMYTAEVTGEKTFAGRACWILKLTARQSDVSYPSRLMCVDKERFLPLYEERYAKSGKLLKTTTIQAVMQVKDRWYPQQVLYKDELSKGKGTLFVIDTIEIDLPVPAHIFTKASLKK